MPLSPGSRLGPYEILAQIGEGGMGEVYRATDTRLGRIVAVKVLNRAHMQRFESEARAIAALNHPHICALYDIGPDYLVMEYVEGKPLAGPLPTAEALTLASQIASALEEAHSKAITHRDLKPANILVSKSGVKLLDFGLAKVAQASEGSADVTQTQAGTILGTAAYMSPEQAQGQTVDARSDIFSFGLVLYEMLSGRRAFPGETAISILAAILYKDPTPLDASAPINGLLMRCLAKRPDDRFQNMAEVRASLEGLDNTAAPVRQASIAVLPFADLSPAKDNEYFSDGLAEEILNALTHVPDLKVIARTSAFAFKGRHEDIRRIAETLGVAHVLEGSVRKAGSRVRISTQLINAADGSHVWSERYDRDLTDVFALQDEIARAIASALELKLSTKATGRGRRPHNLAAYEALLQGRHHSFKATPDALVRAKECFDRAISLDPECAAAHADLAWYYWGVALSGTKPAREVLPLAHAAAARALQLDSSLSHAHALLGVAAACFDHDWTEAGRRFDIAMAGDPPAEARQFYAGFYLAPLGRWQHALEQMDRAVERDPLNLLFRTYRGQILAQAGLGDRAEAEFFSALKIDDFWLAHAHLGIHYAVAQRDREAVSEMETAYRLAPWNLRLAALLAGILMRIGEANRAEELIGRVERGPGPQMATSMGVYHVLCSEMEAAADWFEKATESRDPSFFIYFQLPLLRPLQSSPRWPRLKEMLNLPEAWESAVKSSQ